MIYSPYMRNKEKLKNERLELDMILEDVEEIVGVTMSNGEIGKLEP